MKEIKNFKTENEKEMKDMVVLQDEKTNEYFALNKELYGYIKDNNISMDVKVDKAGRVKLDVELTYLHLSVEKDRDAIIEKLSVTKERNKPSIKVEEVKSTNPTKKSAPSNTKKKSEPVQEKDERKKGEVGIFVKIPQKESEEFRSYVFNHVISKLNRRTFESIKEASKFISTEILPDLNGKWAFNAHYTKPNDFVLLQSYTDADGEEKRHVAYISSYKYDPDYVNKKDRK